MPDVTAAGAMVAEGMAVVAAATEHRPSKGGYLCVASSR